MAIDGDFDFVPANVLSELEVLKASSIDTISSHMTPFQEVVRELSMRLPQLPHFSIGQSQNQELVKLVSKLSEVTGFAIDSPEMSFLVAQGMFIVFAPFLLAFLQADVGFDTPYDVGSTSYDVKKADMFYNARPKLVFSRLLRLAGLTSNFNFKLL